MTVSPSPSLPGSPPIPRTRLIGRQSERATARTLLLDEAVPLLTLTGPGGSGKTRLALAIAAEVADRFADGIAWIDMSPLADPVLVPLAVAKATGFIPVPNRPIEEELVRHLQPRQMLLLVDNCEHLLAAVGDLVAPLLSFCPALQVVATSRAPLRLRGEYALSVAPLSVPHESDHAHGSYADSPAVQLFVERARAANVAAIAGEEALPMVAEICRSVDGLPLAIELAAARLRVLPLAALRDRLQQRLPLLEGGPRDAPARQRTMRDTIAWSYDLLGAAEQTLMQRLAVFAGDCTLEAAQMVAGDAVPPDVLPLLEQLVEHQLVRSPSGGVDPRYAMLETIREFGVEQLTASGNEQETRRRHAEYVLHLVDKFDAYCAPYLPDAQQILDRLEAEYPNLRAALGWLRDTGDVTHLLELAGALCSFWQLRGHIREGREWLEWGLSQASDGSPRPRAAAQLALAGILYQQIEYARTLELCDEAIGSFAEAGDAMGVVLACRCATPAAYNSGQLERAAAYVAHARSTLATADPQPWLAGLVSDVEFQRGVIAFIAGQFAAAERLLAESVATQRALAQETGVELPYACWPLYVLGQTNSAMGHRARALSRFQAALAHARRFQDQEGVVATLTGVAQILAAEGRWQASAQLFGAAETLCERFGYPFWKMAWQWQRVAGLPEPWQRGDAPIGRWDALRAAVVASGSPPLPPLPDPAAAAEHWAAGRGLPIEVAVDYALAVDLTAPSADPPIVAAGVAESAGTHRLSAREQEVLVLLCQRLTDPQIAERLFLSPRTVESHVASLLRKLDVATRRDAAAAAVRLGLV